MASFGSYNADDPLGIAVKSRGMDRRFQAQMDNFGHPTFGPLPDPMWEGMFQAMGEKGVNRLVGGNSPQSNSFTGVKQLANEVDPLSQPQATGARAYGSDPLVKSASGITGTNDPLIGIGNAANQVGGKYLTNGQWMARQSPGPKRGVRVRDQRGTLGNNQSQKV